METIRRRFHNLSLRKSIVCYIAGFMLLAVLLSGLTEGACGACERRIREKYVSNKERYYLTNEDGERLGEGTYIWMGDPGWTNEDARTLQILERVSALSYPFWTALCFLATSLLFYRNKLRRPLRILTEAAEKISRNELDFTVDYDNQDEMGTLCRSFETMRGALEKNQISMWRAVEERKRLNAAFAHDLRTPLTVLKGYNEMQRSSENGAVRETAAVMGRHLERLEHYVGEMSRIRRMEEREPEYRETDPGPWLASMEEGSRLFCGAKGKTLRFQAQVRPGKLRLDAELIQQVLDNLLSNAARYAEETVCVSVREVPLPEEERRRMHGTDTACGLELAVSDGGPGFGAGKERRRMHGTDTACGLELAVSDDGPGFGAGKERRGTDAACGLELAVSDDGPGFGAGEERQAEGGEHMGLGLYICRVLCERHGGNLTARDTADAAGACVRAVFAVGKKNL